MSITFSDGGWTFDPPPLPTTCDSCGQPIHDGDKAWLHGSTDGESWIWHDGCPDPRSAHGHEGVTIVGPASEKRHWKSVD